MEATTVELAVLKTQMARIVSDIESEKATRVRINTELFRRIDESDDRTAEKIKESDDRTADKFEELRGEQRRSDRILYMILGGIAVLNVVIGILVTLHENK